MYRAFQSFRSFSAAIALLVASLALGAPTRGQSEELYPPMPSIGAGGGFSCDEPGASDLPVCGDWLRAVEAWQQRQKAKGIAPTEFLSDEAPQMPNIGGPRGVSCFDTTASYNPTCVQWVKDLEAWKQRQIAKKEAVRKAAEERVPCAWGSDAGPV